MLDASGHTVTDLTKLFHPSNNISHDTGYVLTLDMNSPKDWDDWYTPIDDNSNLRVIRKEDYDKLSDADKAKYREDAFYELEKLAKTRLEERQVSLKSKNVYIGSKIFESQYVSKAFGDKVILKDFYYNFARFEKMGIVGNNGSGKSTFLKMLLGIVPPDSGKFDIGDTVQFGYFSQDGLQFDEQQKVIDIVRDIAEYIDLGQGRQYSASQLLQHFLFTPEQQYNYVYKLSGGEKRKLYLCTVLMRNPNFLVLDEPTNDLDIKTLQILEDYLQNFPGCVIVVSHDRYFMDKIVDHLLIFHGDGEVQAFPGI